MLAEWLDEICKFIVPNILTFIKPLIITFLSTSAIGGIAEGYVLNKKYNHDLKTAKVITSRPMVKIVNALENNEQSSYENLPPELISFDEETKKRIIERHLSNIIKEFVTTLEEKSDKLNLFFMYDNLRSLKIIKANDSFKNYVMKYLIGWNGVYFTGKNEIKLSENSKTTFFHELFHMATSFKRYGIDYCGFSQFNKEVGTIGTGINEGYTNLLVEHYFGLKNGTYENEVKIVRQIEDIIGRDTMERLYFKADLQGLIDEISKHTSLENAFTLVQKTDYITYINNHHKWGFHPIKKMYLDKSITAITEIITDMSNTKNQSKSKF